MTNAHISIFPTPIHLPIYAKVDAVEVIVGTLHIEIDAEATTFAIPVEPTPVDF